MFFRDFDHQSLEQAGFVSRAQHVGMVVEIDFELAGAEFRGNRAGVDLLLAAGANDVVDDLLEIGDARTRQHGRGVLAAGFRIIDDLQQTACVALPVEQVELEFESYHRRPAALRGRNASAAG